MNFTIVAGLALVATVSLAQSATVMLSARGQVTAALGTIYSPAGVGSQVEVLVSYEGVAPDLDVSPSIARYEPANFSIALSLLGGPNIFQTTVGSITVYTPSGTFPAVHVLARLPDGNSLFFLFRDDDRSFVSSDALPTSYGSIVDWDSIDLSIVLYPFMPPGLQPFDVSFSEISIPEPTSTSFAALLFILGLSRRTRDHARGRTRRGWTTTGAIADPVPPSNANIHRVVHAHSHPSGASA
jgi:hypothetical protein